jgi:hypothetical protein
VVLHLPDLDALAAVALGPPKSRARRRVDAPHFESSARSEENVAATPAAAGDSSRQLVRLLRVPLLKLAPQLLAGGGAALGKTLVLLQKPKMALAAVVAIGLQLAAVLAMFSDNGTNDGGANSAQTAVPLVQMPIAVHAGPNDPIQTPATVFGNTPALPPQTLPGLTAEDLPASPGEGRTPQLVGPSSPAASNQPAKLVPPTESTSAQTPTLAPPALPQLTSPKVAPAVRTGDAAAAKPKARLQGTIKKISTTGTTP